MDRKWYRDPEHVNVSKNRAHLTDQFRSSVSNKIVLKIKKKKKKKRVEAPLEGACFLMTNPVTHGNPSWTAHCRTGKVTTYWRRPSSDPVPCTAFGCLGIYFNQSSLLSLCSYLCFFWTRVNHLITLGLYCYDRCLFQQTKASAAQKVVPSFSWITQQLTSK